MKIILTGGTGLVGNALGQALVRQGHELHVLTRSIAGARQRLSYPCKLWPWEETSSPPPIEALAGADVLVHLAGESVVSGRWTSKRKARLRQSRIQTARALAKAIQTPLKLYISASGIGYYGDCGIENLDEDSGPGKDFLANLCREWEAVSQEVPAARRVQARFGVILSPLGGFLSQVTAMFRWLGASRLGSGRQFVSWVHIDDVVAILLRAINHGEMNGAYNVVAPHPETNSQLTQHLKEKLHAKSAPPVPGLALRLIYGELSTALLGSQRAYPKRLIAEGFRFHYPDLVSALAAVYPNLQQDEMQTVVEAWVPGNLKTIWEFFASEKNLELLAPEKMNFKVSGKTTPDMRVQTRLNYRLTVHGIPMRWQSLITQWEPERRFADEQIKGPYRKWNHVHDFEPLAQGVLIRDTVHWSLPMGAIGRLVALPFVLKEVDEVFRVRARAIDRTFFPR